MGSALTSSRAGPPAEGAARGLRIAIASRDGSALDAHFGSAQRFVIYDVAAGGCSFVRAVEMTQVSDESGDHDASSDDRNARKITLLGDCQIVFVLAIGAPVAARVLRAGIHPIKVAEAEPVDSVLSRVKGFLVADPPPWLRKVLAAQAPRSMGFLDDD